MNSKYKLTAILDLGELEDLLEFLDKKITIHETESKLKYLCKEITDYEYKWHKQHALYLKGIRKKLKYKRIGKS